MVSDKFNNENDLSGIWQCWVDVGGTFTDCMVRGSDRRVIRAKVLSSAVTKGRLAAGGTRTRIVDPLRVEPDGFWTGYDLTIFADDGRAVGSAKVLDFDRSQRALLLAEPLGVAPRQGQAYELVSGDEAPIFALRRIFGLALHDPFPSIRMRLGTTRGTNALVTRSGARVALVTTRGFGDVLRIGYQDRPRLFELSITKPEPLYAAVAEVDERIAADGQILKPLDPHEVRKALMGLCDEGIESLAICLMHGAAHAQHEVQVAAVARELGFVEISLSHQVAPVVKLVSRGDTTVVDAYLNPVLRSYVGSLRKGLFASRRSGPEIPPRLREDSAAESTATAGDLRILTSAGGLVDADRFFGKDSILSGPAGGVVGFARVAQAAGFERAIGFDMGGTSTDVARFDGRFQLEYETEKAGVRVVAPMMAIETVAAGGGSVCWFDGVKLAVGPQSAGADPGPACYGRGGPLAVTDLNVRLGKVSPHEFPFPLDLTAIDSRLERLADDVHAATAVRYEPVALADGLVKLANANMVQAIRSISIAQGADPRHYVMVSFGGAAPQHACAVARDLGIRQILNHPDGGILSALGIGLADVVRHRSVPVEQPLTRQLVVELEATFHQLADDACREVAEELGADRGDAAVGNASFERMTVESLLDIRYQGMDSTLTIPRPTDGDFQAAFAAEHERLYGYRHPGRELEVAAARVAVMGRTGEPLGKSARAGTVRQRAAKETRRAYFDATPHQAAMYRRDDLRPGDLVRGPAIIREPNSTTVIDPGWQGELLTGGELLLTDTGTATPERLSTQCDPLMLEVFNNKFAGIAAQMGITLRNTASSINVKERLDFSCAIFTNAGDLVVNAPHIPVHLGAMGETVRRILADNPDMQPGDVYVTNDPYRGGSHLPDVTVVTPVHEPRTGQRLFFTASRAHHAEIGGIRPGSMPPLSSNLGEEGVLIRNFKLVDGHRSREMQLRQLLLQAEHPTRNVEDNLADIASQIAANRQGERDLVGLVDRYTLPVVDAYMQHIQAAAEEKTRTALARIPDGVYRFTDHMDDGTPICVAIAVQAGTATFDFTGSGPVSRGNFNANRPIVSAAVIYVLRLLIDEPIPLNQGVLRPIELVLPEGLLNPPEGVTADQCPAVVGGNVETSQRIVDVLLGALGLAAASQGTMNNLALGDPTFGYYETICGGAGATRGSAGADALQTHMTNTRLTDPEVIERRFPLRVVEFRIRRGSGGQGIWPGGDGVIRRLELLRQLQLSILSQRRGPYPPYGLDGGHPGQLGRNLLTRRDGSEIPLPACADVTALPGDVLSIETPGGGGVGQLPLQTPRESR